jgi:hypothetical protein
MATFFNRQYLHIHSRRARGNPFANQICVALTIHRRQHIHWLSRLHCWPYIPTSKKNFTSISSEYYLMDEFLYGIKILGYKWLCSQAHDVFIDLRWYAVADLFVCVSSPLIGPEFIGWHCDKCLQRDTTDVSPGMLVDLADISGQFIYVRCRSTVSQSQVQITRLSTSQTQMGWRERSVYLKGFISHWTFLGFTTTVRYSSAQ